MLLDAMTLYEVFPIQIPQALGFASLFARVFTKSGYQVFICLCVWFFVFSAWYSRPNNPFIHYWQQIWKVQMQQGGCTNCAKPINLELRIFGQTQKIA